MKPIYKTEFLPFLLINLSSSVLREDIHLRFWEDSDSQNEMFEFFVESILTLIRLFILFNKYNVLLEARTGELVERDGGIFCGPLRCL